MKNFQITKSNTLDSAISICNSRRRFKLHLVLKGDAGEFWIAMGADAQRLEKMGYEILY